jgi:hypothetical protein
MFEAVVEGLRGRGRHALGPSSIVLENVRASSIHFTITIAASLCNTESPTSILVYFGKLVWAVANVDA